MLNHLGCWTKCDRTRCKRIEFVQLCTFFENPFTARRKVVVSFVSHSEGSAVVPEHLKRCHAETLESLMLASQTLWSLRSVRPMSAWDQVAQLVKANNMIDRQTTRMSCRLTRSPASFKNEGQVCRVGLRSSILNCPSCRNRIRRVRRSVRLTCRP
jgi:hypothetical protein